MASSAPPETQLDRVLLALGHPTRRAMLLRLRKAKSIRASILQDLAGIAYQTTWKHILVLERAGLIERLQQGSVQPITLRTTPLDELREWMAVFYPGKKQADTVPPMPNADDPIRSLIDSFVNDLSELVKDSALDAVRQALHEGGATKSNGRSSNGGVRGIAPSRKPGAKRTPEELERMTSALLAFVKKNPGQRIEQIAVGMGVTTNDLKLPAKKLLAANSVKTKGVKRATKYFAK